MCASQSLSHRIPAFRASRHLLPRPELAVLFLATLLLGQAVQATQERAAALTSDPVFVPEALLLGPLPLPPAPAAAPMLQGEIEPVAEIDPRAPFPVAGAEISLSPDRPLSWRRASAAPADSGGTPVFLLDRPGVYWLAARLRAARWTEVGCRVTGEGSLTLYLDGIQAAQRTGPSADGAEGALESETGVARGLHTLLLRIEAMRPEQGADAGPGGQAAAWTPSSIAISAAATPDADLAWSLARARPPAEFDLSRRIASFGDLAVAPEGKLFARRLSRRDPVGEGRRQTVNVFDRTGRLVAEEVGGDGARPLAFAPDWRRLLLSLPATEGRDLALWNVQDRRLQFVLRGEPAPGLVRFSPDGRYLLLSSTRGTTEEGGEATSPRRVVALREKLPDWDDRFHLYLIEIATGARRRLTSPGDQVLDDAVFLPGGRRIVYGRTLPQPERPWFHTELRLLDLASGQDTLVADFTAGWEVRPQHFAPSPDGRRLAFLGPPDQVGGGRPEHNVYNKQVWLLELATGRLERITRDQPYAFAGGPQIPGWRDADKLIVLIQSGARRRLAVLSPAENGWSAEPLPPDQETCQAAALSPDGRAVLAVLSAPAVPPYLVAWELPAGEMRVLERPNAPLTERWTLAEPRDAGFTGPGGQRIEAWSYAPTFPEANRVSLTGQGNGGVTPLILYYYGGVSPTARGFNFTHQWLAANGYAVLVINPRGAFGYGESFADVHVRDWGPQATGDLLAGLDAFLAAHAEVDSQRIGIYGGSYGGFVTEYLVSTTDRFAAAVAMYGISDLATYWGQGAWGWTYGDMSLGGATPWSAPDLFTLRSPLFRADRITTPLLLLHGLADVNVTPGESRQLFTALASQDRPVELVLFPEEGHGLSGTFAARIGHRTMMLEWFDRFLRDQPEAWHSRWN
jgi:dipeptidyl aminopeptidase/acylaminoacyl peptidase